MSCALAGCAALMQDSTAGYQPSCLWGLLQAAPSIACNSLNLQNKQGKSCCCTENEGTDSADLPLCRDMHRRPCISAEANIMAGHTVFIMQQMSDVKQLKQAELMTLIS